MNDVLKKIVRLILRIVWEPWSLKRSHWFDWEDFDLDLYGDDVVYVRGNSSALPRSSIVSNLLQTNFGWKQVVFIKAANDWKRDGNIRVGFSCSEEKKQQICQCPLPKDTVVGLLIGPHDFAAFLVDEDGNQIPAVSLGRCHKKDLPKEVVLL